MAKYLRFDGNEQAVNQGIEYYAMALGYAPIVDGQLNAQSSDDFALAAIKNHIRTTILNYTQQAAMQAAAVAATNQANGLLDAVVITLENE